MTTVNDMANDHARAIGLLTEAAEGLSAGDTAWLQRHLGGCAECSRYAELQQTVSSVLKSVTAVASPKLVAMTQARLRVRTVELRERQSRSAMLALSIALGVITSLIWGFAVWNLAQWAQQYFELSSLALAPGMLLLWALILSPASLIAAYFLLTRREARGSLERALN